MQIYKFCSRGGISKVFSWNKTAQFIISYVNELTPFFDGINELEDTGFLLVLAIDGDGFERTMRK